LGEIIQRFKFKNSPSSSLAFFPAPLFFNSASANYRQKLVLLLFQRRKASSWMRLIAPLITNGDLDAHSHNRSNERLMISEGDRAATEEPYHDEINGGQDERTNTESVIGNGNRPRVEPSGLTATHGGEIWQEEA
jgi:hypothetical protein